MSVAERLGLVKGAVFSNFAEFDKQFKLYQAETKEIFVKKCARVSTRTVDYPSRGKGLGVGMYVSVRFVVLLTSICASIS